MDGEKQQDLFFIRRNTNRNEVHYAIRTDASGCLPLPQNPVSGYWQMHEKGQGVTEPITIFEQLAFGIGSQQVAEGVITLKLIALPDRPIRIQCDGEVPCRFRAYISLSGAEAELTSFYAYAEPGFIMPTVKYYEIHGLRGGTPVSERINR